MSLLKRIQETEFYKELNSVKKNISLKRQNRLVIQHGYEVAKNLGLAQFEKQTAYNYINFGIIKELLLRDAK